MRSWLIIGATALALWWYLARSSAAPSDPMVLRTGGATVPPSATVAADVEPTPVMVPIYQRLPTSAPSTPSTIAGALAPKVPIGEAMPGYHPSVFA